MARHTLQSTRAATAKLGALVRKRGAMMPGPKGLMIDDGETVALIGEIARRIDKPKWQVVRDALLTIERR